MPYRSQATKNYTIIGRLFFYFRFQFLSLTLLITVPILMNFFFVNCNLNSRLELWTMGGPQNTCQNMHQNVSTQNYCVMGYCLMRRYATKYVCSSRISISGD